jgi:hypothetical protein
MQYARHISQHGCAMVRASRWRVLWKNTGYPQDQRQFYDYRGLCQRQKLYPHLLEIFEEGRKTGELKPDLDTRLARDIVSAEPWITSSHAGCSWTCLIPSAAHRGKSAPRETGENLSGSGVLTGAGGWG